LTPVLNPHIFSVSDIQLHTIKDKTIRHCAQRHIEKNWKIVDWQVVQEIVCAIVLDHLIKNKNLRVGIFASSLQAHDCLKAIVKQLENTPVNIIYLYSGKPHEDIHLPCQMDISNGYASTTELDICICLALHPPVGLDVTRVVQPFELECYINLAWKQNLQAAYSFAEKIQHCILSNKPLVIFIAIRHGNHPTIEHIARGLQFAHNISTFGIYLDPEPPKNVFSDTFCCNSSLGILAQLLTILPTCKIYLQAYANWSYLCQFIKAISPKHFIVQEIYDWMGAFIDNKNSFIKEGLFSSETIKLMQQSEKFACNHLEGLIYKDGGEWISKKLANSRTPNLQVAPCPPKTYMFKPNNLNHIAQYKLVYAGQVCHSKMSTKLFGDIYYIPVIKELSSQDMHITVYNALHATQKHPTDLYQEYINESNTNPNFDFKPGIPFPEIIKELNYNFHFGLIAYYFEHNLDVGNAHLSGTMASKLFTYIAAGLPVIVSARLGYMADFVSKENIGIVVDNDDIRNLNAILQSINYSMLQSNVLLAQEKFAIDKQIPAIKQLLKFT